MSTCLTPNRLLSRYMYYIERDLRSIHGRQGLPLSERSPTEAGRGWTSVDNDALFPTVWTRPSGSEQTRRTAREGRGARTVSSLFSQSTSEEKVGEGNYVGGTDVNNAYNDGFAGDELRRRWVGRRGRETHGASRTP